MFHTNVASFPGSTAQRFLHFGKTRAYFSNYFSAKNTGQWSLGTRLHKCPIDIWLCNHVASCTIRHLVIHTYIHTYIRNQISNDIAYMCHCCRSKAQSIHCRSGPVCYIFFPRERICNMHMYTVNVWTTYTLQIPGGYGTILLTVGPDDSINSQGNKYLTDSLTYHSSPDPHTALLLH